MTSNSFKIRREDPPKRTRKVGDSTKIDREVAFLKKHPNEWFKVREGAAGGAYRVYKMRGCETRSKTVAEGRYDIWAMWTGDNK